MTPGDVVDWLDDLIATPSLTEQLAFIQARPDLFAEKPEPVAHPINPLLAIDAALGGARGGALGGLGGIFGGAQAMRNEMAAFQAAERQQMADARMVRASYERAARDYDNALVTDRAQRAIAAERLKAGHLSVDERAVLEEFMRGSK